MEGKKTFIEILKGVEIMTEKKVTQKKDIEKELKIGDVVVDELGREIGKLNGTKYVTLNSGYAYKHGDEIRVIMYDKLNKKTVTIDFSKENAKELKKFL